MAAQVLVTMQVTTNNTTLADGRIEERLAALVRDCFAADADHASISVQAHDPDEAPADDVCGDCGALVSDAGEHASWHRAILRALGAPTTEPDEMRCFGEEPAHA